MSCLISASACITKALLCAHIRFKMILELETDYGASTPHKNAKEYVRDLKICSKFASALQSIGALHHAHACSGSAPSKTLLSAQLGITPKLPSRLAKYGYSVQWGFGVGDLG